MRISTRGPKMPTKLIRTSVSRFDKERQVPRDRDRSGKGADWPPVEALSVQDLIARHQNKSDPWRLALVQRSEVWDESRVAKLLDSLLVGLPDRNAPRLPLAEERRMSSKPTAKGPRARPAAPG